MSLPGRVKYSHPLNNTKTRDKAPWATRIVRGLAYLTTFSCLELVLQVDGAVVPGSSLRLDRCALTLEQKEKLCKGGEGEEDNLLLDERRYVIKGLKCKYRN